MNRVTFTFILERDNLKTVERTAEGWEEIKEIIARDLVEKGPLFWIIRDAILTLKPRDKAILVAEEFLELRE